MKSVKLSDQVMNTAYVHFKFKQRSKDDSICSVLLLGDICTGEESSDSVSLNTFCPANK